MGTLGFTTVEYDTVDVLVREALSAKEMFDVSKMPILRATILV